MMARSSRPSAEGHPRRWTRPLGAAQAQIGTGTAAIRTWSRPGLKKAAKVDANEYCAAAAIPCARPPWLLGDVHSKKRSGKPS